MQATAQNRLLAYKRRLLILDLLEGKKMTSIEVTQHISEQLHVIKTDLKRLYLMRYLSRERKFQPDRKAYVFAYTTKKKTLPMPNLNISDEVQEKVDKADFKNNFKRESQLPAYMIHQAKVIVSKSNPNLTTYINSNRPASDYNYQKTKNNINRGISSTFEVI